VFGGRARRKEYWYFTLFNFLAFFMLTFIDGVIGILAAIAIPAYQDYVERAKQTEFHQNQ